MFAYGSKIETLVMIYADHIKDSPFIIPSHSIGKVVEAIPKSKNRKSPSRVGTFYVISFLIGDDVIYYDVHEDEMQSVV